MKIVYVKWRDAHYKEDIDLDRRIVDGAYIIETVGFEIEGLKDELTIVMEIHVGKDRVKYRVAIPKKYIIEMRELKWGRK